MKDIRSDENVELRRGTWNASVNIPDESLRRIESAIRNKPLDEVDVLFERAEEQRPRPRHLVAGAKQE